MRRRLPLVQAAAARDHSYSVNIVTEQSLERPSENNPGGKGSGVIRYTGQGRSLRAIPHFWPRRLTVMRARHG